MNNEVLPYDPTWAKAYAAEAEALAAAIGDILVDLHHIGSTAVPGCMAKPIIDMLGVVTSLGALDAVADRIVRLGYEYMGAYGIEARRYFRKIDASGRRTHHLHCFKTRSPDIERHLAFRDYLRAHPEKAAEYSDLKVRLLAADDASWESYLEGKDPFIASMQRDALEWYRQSPAG